MIYEYRAYEVAPGKMPDMHNRFRNHTLKFFAKYDMQVIAFFNPVIGESNNILTYILAFRDLAHRETAWKAFSADKEWQQILAKSNENGQIVTKLISKIFEPTDYSPLQ